VAEYILYDVQVRLLTPLHIGSGRELLHKYDYAIHGGRTWRLDEGAILAMQETDDPAWTARLTRIPPADLLREEDFRADAPYFRYLVRGVPRSAAEGIQVREQLKDPYDRPYLPGSSLKGALRTALAWHGWKVLNLRPDKGRLKPNPRFAAQDYERRIFGKNPNHDLLRALQVGDSEPVGADRLILVNARVLHRSGATASPIELEALAPNTVLPLRIKLDEALFSAWARRRGLTLRGREWLEQLLQIVRQHTAQRLADEVAWFTGVPGAERVADFYRRLSQTGLPAHAFLIQVGWGTGWDDKTFGSHLRADERFMEGILAPRRRGGYGLARGRLRRGDPFPKSRRVLVRVRRGPGGQVHEEPAAPLGWLLVEMRPR